MSRVFCIFKASGVFFRFGFSGLISCGVGGGYGTGSGGGVSGKNTAKIEKALFQNPAKKLYNNDTLVNLFAT